jgi:hydroxyacylglutathione hydrolase
MLQVKRFVFSPFYENTYIVWDDQNNEGAIIDPGCYDIKERKIVDEFIQSQAIKLIYLINTHCHIDHIFGNAYIKSKYNPIYLAPEKDVFMLDLMIETANNYNVEFTPSPKPDQFISEENGLLLGEHRGIFLFTPGHTPGEYCLYFENENICFTGDLLFKENIGRTDLWGGNYDTLIESIKNKLMTLPDDVVIYPGHDSDSTIRYEKMFNPFLKTT